MDPEADNYDASANVSGFCSYPVEGCTDASAANYSDTAVTDDGSCLYPGCTDPTALNYDPSPTLTQAVSFRSKAAPTHRQRTTIRWPTPTMAAVNTRHLALVT